MYTWRSLENDLAFVLKKIVQVRLIDWSSRRVGVVYVVVVILDFNVSVLDVVYETHHLFVLDSTGLVDTFVPEFV